MRLRTSGDGSIERGTCMGRQTGPRGLRPSTQPIYSDDKGSKVSVEATSSSRYSPPPQFVPQPCVSPLSGQPCRMRVLQRIRTACQSPVENSNVEAHHRNVKGAFKQHHSRAFVLHVCDSPSTVFNFPFRCTISETRVFAPSKPLSTPCIVTMPKIALCAS